MKISRIAAFLMSLLLVLTSLIACGNPGGGDETTPAPAASDTNPAAETTSSLYDEEGYLKDDLPDGLNFDTTITTLMWSDYTMTEFYVEENNGNIIDSAIFKRNAGIEARLGVTLEWDSVPGSSGKESQYISKVRADRSADCTYDIYATYSRIPPTLSLEGFCVDLLSTKYFDIEKPWWPKALTNECAINNKLYYASGDISTNLLWMMIGTFYNRSLYSSFGLGATPEELVKSNGWTMETMFNMCKEVYVDTDGSNSATDGDTYGFVIFETNVDAFQTAGGVTSVVRTNDGGIEISDQWYGQYTADIVQLVGDFLATSGVRHSGSTNIRNIFYEERAIFITDRCFIVAGKDNASSKTKIEFSYGIIPQPKYSADQENFMTNVGHPFTMYAIADSSHNVDAASAVLEAMGSGGYRNVTPAVFETTMKVRYADGAEVAEMYDLIRDNISFDLGRLYAETFGNTTANAFRKAALGIPSSYLTSIKVAQNTFKKAIATITEN